MHEHPDLEHIVQQTYDAEHFLTSVTEESSGRIFPPGTRSWIVEHESRTCTHSPRCHWFGRIYEYRGRYTLVRDMEMPFITMGDLIDRVTGAIAN